MKRRSLGREWLIAVSASLVSSCGILPPLRNCSDLEIGDRLLVTIREPLDSPACDPGLGLVDGAELTLNVEAFSGDTSCGSAIGPAALNGVALEYWVEAAEAAAGSEAFVSVSREFGPCLGGVNFRILRDQNPSDTAEDMFDEMRVSYQGSSDAGCPAYCDVPYAVDVERL